MPKLNREFRNEDIHFVCQDTLPPTDQARIDAAWKEVILKLLKMKREQEAEAKASGDPQQ